MNRAQAQPRASRKAVVTCPFCGTSNRVDLGRVDDRPKCGQCGRPLLLDRPIKVTDDDFERVVTGSEVPIIVDFHADWCGPCKIMAPLLDEIAHSRRGRLLVAKLDTDANPNTSLRYQIRGIPTLIVFRDGQEAVRQTGAIPRAQLEQLVDSALA
ncbi:MAG: thioredoxin TrxC [Longimicrobiales bacterium]